MTMAFFVFPTIVAGEAAPGLLVDPDTGLRAWCSAEIMGSLGLRDGWIITDSNNPVPSLRVGQTAMPAEDFLYNGARVWSGGGRCCFKSVSDGWILLEGGADPKEPAAAVGLDGETWEGDAWWRFSEPGRDNPAPSLVPKGTLLNQTSPSAPALEWFWPRWERDGGQSCAPPLGTYSGADGAEASAAVRTIGSLVFRDGGGAAWTESADGSAFACPGRGLVLREENGSWVAGDTDGEWWLASGRPSRSGGCTLSPRGANAEDRGSFALAFWKFDWAPERATVLVAETALWR